MANMELISSLTNDLQRAKQGLKDIDENIRRVTGRDPNENRKRPLKRNELDHNRPPKNPDIKLITADFDDDKSSLNPVIIDFGLSSQVNPSPRRTRQDALTNALNATDKARGRRMFGLLQGTLNAAKKDNEDKSASIQEKKIREIDERLEKEHKIEKEKHQKERAELYDSRRRQRIELFILEDRISKTKEFEDWKADSLKMIGFISTKCSPSIFYKPLSENKESILRVNETEQTILKNIKERENKLYEELDQSEKLRRSRLNESLKSRSNESISKVKTDEHDNDEDDIDALLMSNANTFLSQVSAVNKVEPDQFSNDSSSHNGSDVDLGSGSEEGQISPKRTVRRVVEAQEELGDTRRINLESTDSEVIVQHKPSISSSSRVQNVELLKKEFDKARDEFEKVKALISTNQNSSSVDEIFQEQMRSAIKLQELFNENSSDMVTYDLQRFQSSLQQLKNDIRDFKLKTVPKKKFTFSTSNTKQTKKQITSKEILNKPDGNQSNCADEFDVGLINFAIKNIEDRCDLTIEEDTEGEPILLENLKNCTIKLASLCGIIFIRNLINCRLSTGPVAGSIFMEGCKECDFLLVTRQLRIHKTDDCNFGLLVCSRPIIEHCHRLKFCEYMLDDIPEIILRQLKQAHFPTPPFANLWDNVDDFQRPDALTTGHLLNWRKLNESEIKAFFNKFSIIPFKNKSEDHLYN